MPRSTPSPAPPAAEGAGAVLLGGHAALAELPLWAQVLLAARQLERARLALATAIPPQLNTLLARCHSAMGDCASAGGLIAAHTALFDSGIAQRYAEAEAGPATLRHALYYAIDATRAADAAQDFPIDATVANSARRCLAALAAEPRFIPLQLGILLAADIDLLRFHCREAGIGRYDALGAAALQRLPALRALDGVTPATPEHDR